MATAAEPSGGPDLGAASIDSTRKRVLSVALELFAERSFGATTTRELAERLGFTKAALYYHFRTKDDLLAALLAPVLAATSELLEDAINGPQSPAARRDLLRRYVDLVVENRRLVQLLSQDRSALNSPALASDPPQMQGLMLALAGSAQPDTYEKTRARAALGAIHAAVLDLSADDDPEVMRTAAWLAACGALGLPAPRLVTPGRPARRHPPRS